MPVTPPPMPDTGTACGKRSASTAAPDGQAFNPACNEGFLGARLADLVCGDMRWCMVANTMLDLRWLLSACPDLARAGRMVLVHDKCTSRASLLDSAREAGIADKVVAFQPHIPDPKFFILEYAAGLRVIVTTANCIYADVHTQTQGLFHQDFPFHEGVAAEQSGDQSFGEDLLQALVAMGMPPTITKYCADLLGHVDFSSARGKIVASAPGWHSGAGLHSWGHMRLRACLAAAAPWPAAFRGSPLASSLGAISERWLVQEFGASLAAGRCERAAGSRFTGSWGGELARRESVMPHLKTYCRWAAGPAGTAEVAWLLVASHNTSRAAWGGLELGGTQLFIRSHEMGVLLLPEVEAGYRSSSHCAFRCTGLGSAVTSPPPHLPVAAPLQQQAPRAQQAQQAVQPQQAQQQPPQQQQQQPHRRHHQQQQRQPALVVRYVQWSPGTGQAASLEAAGRAGPAPTLRVPLPLPYPLPPRLLAAAGARPWASDVCFPGQDSRGRTLPQQCRRGRDLLVWGLCDTEPWSDILASRGY
ncbi:hypothetical protein ABPG77_006422 [Micractinium sp. CCAP 211/92]